jgi:flagellar protein FlaG
MSIQIAASGNGFQQQELPQERISLSAHSSAQHERHADAQAAAAEMERVSLAFNKRLKFVVDHQSQEITVKVIDPYTDKVIKVLPPEELQRLHKQLRDTIGVLFDERI